MLHEYSITLVALCYLQTTENVMKQQQQQQKLKFKTSAMCTVMICSGTVMCSVTDPRIDVRSLTVMTIPSYGPKRFTEMKLSAAADSYQICFALFLVYCKNKHQHIAESKMLSFRCKFTFCISFSAVFMLVVVGTSESTNPITTIVSWTFSLVMFPEGNPCSEMY